MKLLIEIPEHIYEHAKETTEDSRDEFDAMRAIANGTQQESSSENPNTCGDAISREELIEALDTWDKFGYAPTNELIPLRGNVDKDKYVPYIHYDDVIECIKGMPSVIPQQRTGQWERMSDLPNDVDDRFECSRCGNIVHYNNVMDLRTFSRWCGRCGSYNDYKMEVEE